MEAAEKLYESLTKWADLERLVDEATPEGVYLECKTHTGVQIKQGEKNQIAQTVSAMSNASGGVILLGVSTTHVNAYNFDVVSGLESIGNIEKLAARLEIELPMLTIPPVIGAKIRAIKKGKTGSGIIVIFLPPTTGDPVQTNTDQRFYFRGSEGDNKAPYEVIRRLFSASHVPDLTVFVDEKLSKRNKDKSFKFPIGLVNSSSATARDIQLYITVENFESCVKVSAPGFNDVSNLNPGSKIFSYRPQGVVHRGFNLVVGNLVVSMAGSKYPRRALDISVSMFADQMRARRYKIKVHLKSSGLEVKSFKGPEYLY